MIIFHWPISMICSCGVIQMISQSILSNLSCSGWGEEKMSMLDVININRVTKHSEKFTSEFGDRVIAMNFLPTKGQGSYTYH